MTVKKSRKHSVFYVIIFKESAFTAVKRDVKY